ncbi:hypothetical protein GGR57DRAFT_302066 [Xylariaceae sp. FL1272]|nr:hypothetical protein GGR57DRAFT_302066 [Xylariaceae sp. FL1272]
MHHRLVLLRMKEFLSCNLSHLALCCVAVFPTDTILGRLSRQLYHLRLLKKGTCYYTPNYILISATCIRLFLYMRTFVANIDV